MRIGNMAGSVLPAAIAAATVIAAGMLGLIMLREREMLADLRDERRRQARADAESAFLLYRMHPDDERVTSPDGCRPCGPSSQTAVYVKAEPWGLYETVTIVTADSLAQTCRIAGADPDAETTLYYADGGHALHVAGGTRLRGILHLPRNGLVYGRTDAEFYVGEPVPQSDIRISSASMPPVDTAAEERVRKMLARTACTDRTTGIPERAEVPFSEGTTLRIAVGTAEIADRSLAGRIEISGDEIRIDSTCRLRNVVIIARKVTIGAGARIAAQILARDTVVAEPRATLLCPSGIYAGLYAELGDGATLDGYLIVCDTTRRTPPTANCLQAPAARLRGLLYVDGTADLRGEVTGYACLRSAARFSPQGYYKDMLRDFTLRGNPATAHPIWIAGGSVRRKEAACAD